MGFGWRDLVEPGQVFPVHEDRNAGAGPPWPRFYLPLDFKVIKDLKTAVDSYGVHAPFTIALLEQISFNALTPDDWKQLARATLSPGQYLVWRAAYRELATDQAQRNAQGGNKEWNADMLLGEGARAGNNNQHEYPEPVYGQIQQIGRTAWRALQSKGDLRFSISKVTQGSNEPYADFVSRLMEVAGKLFPDVEQAMPLVKQLAYENANKWCHEAIRPWKHKDLDTWIKICRDVHDQVMLNLDGRSAAERHALGCGITQEQVIWKDVLTKQWKGPHPVLRRTRGAVCVFPQDAEAPVWIPERLTRVVRASVPDNIQDEALDAQAGDPAGNTAASRNTEPTASTMGDREGMASAITGDQ